MKCYKISPSTRTGYRDEKALTSKRGVHLPEEHQNREGATEGRPRKVGRAERGGARFQSTLPWTGGRADALIEFWEGLKTGREDGSGSLLAETGTWGCLLFLPH